jgi:hypothetical protein
MNGIHACTVLESQGSRFSCGGHVSFGGIFIRLHCVSFFPKFEAWDRTVSRNYIRTLFGTRQWSYHNISWWKCDEGQNLIPFTIKGRTYEYHVTTVAYTQNEHVLSIYCLSAVGFKER